MREKGIFRNKVIQTILLSALFLQIGVWVRNFAILLFVMQQTNGDPLAVSMIYVAEYAPIFIFSFIGGTFADRWRPKRTMVWCDILSALSIFGVLLAFVFGTWKAVFFATLISAILSQFSQPSGMKLFKMHLPAEQMQAGMSIYQTLFAIFMILGPALGTFVFQTFGIGVAIAVTGVAFLLSGAVLVRLPADHVEENGQPPTTLWQEMVDGIRYVLKSNILTKLGLCFLAAGLSIGLIQPLSIFLVTERLGLPMESLKWLMTVNGIGMIVGGALTMTVAKKASPQKLLVIGMLVNAVAMSIAGLSTNLWLTLTAQLFNGLFMPCIQIGINTMILKHTEGAFVGRVMGILSPLFTGAMVLTMSIAGPLKKLLSLVSVFEMAALLFIVGLLFIVPLLRSQAGSEQEASG
ncbi:MFS transporter [Brevibacillus borstelensis]|jgi:predicted MFS family arabinose efflux permease|uniref:MFS transporter n=1 Tax=Brevibacillus borstelensis TaxID=45462 RepID=UPI000F07A023|nr:MFS transporter [Brevibacillus borstelensis]MED1881702.1 MFS transporter [Brevibacillus borstelensis]RNB62609.1 MFS transporter [Brevibacillus borstelensis]GED54251.1 MFS transporter [Brevibacillus borstelensis]